MDGLLKEEPNNPYFHELKGQFLFESGRIKESITEYETALKFLPNNPLLQTGLAQAMLENNPKHDSIQRIINLLQKSIISVSNPTAWQLLSRAYEINGQHAASLYAAAEFSYALDNLEIAQKQLENAKKSTPDKSIALKISDLEQRLREDIKKREF